MYWFLETFYFFSTIVNFLHKLVSFPTLIIKSRIKLCLKFISQLIINGIKSHQEIRCISLLLLFIPLLSAKQVLGQNTSPTGQIVGYVADQGTHQPLIGANVFLQGIRKGAATNKDGYFVIKNVPVSTYNITFSYIGYATLVKTDIVVSSGTVTRVKATLESTVVKGEIVEVVPDYYAGIEGQAISTTELSSEEIRRTPGAAGDISRVIKALPSVAKVDDQSNGLAVRGGSTIENSFYIDNIEVPNINHFPAQGTTGGAIGMLNTNLIENVSFYPGGYGAKYGGALSSVMNINLRDGGPKPFAGNVDLDFLGFSGTANGTLPKQSGSWLFYGRRSYMDLLADIADIPVVPSWSDVQAKLVYHVAKRHQIEVLDILATDNNQISQKRAKDLDVQFYGNQSHLQNTLGINWRWIWQGNGYSKTSLSHTITTFNTDFTKYGTSIRLQNATIEQTLKFRNINHYQLGHRSSLNFGFESRYFFPEYDRFYNEPQGPFGEKKPPFHLNEQVTGTNISAFGSLKFAFGTSVEAKIGIRETYFSFTKDYTMAPRLSLTYHLSPQTSISGAAGRYYQHQPLILAMQQSSGQTLKPLRSTHYSMSFKQLITPSTRFTVTAYYKSYQHFPMDPTQPKLFIIDEPIYGEGFFAGHSKLVNKGKAYATGIEVMIQKKLTDKLYGLISGSYFRARYKDLDGTWRNRSIDNRFIASLVGGYKLDANWNFSFRWTYAGGRPYTPLDIAASHQQNQAVFDATRVNGAHYPAYHSLDVRVDRRFYFGSTNLTVYLSVWNIYDRANVATYYWDLSKNKMDIQYQRRLTPIFGVKFGF